MNERGRELAVGRYLEASPAEDDPRIARLKHQGRCRYCGQYLCRANGRGYCRNEKCLLHMVHVEV